MRFLKITVRRSRVCARGCQINKGEACYIPNFDDDRAVLCEEHFNEYCEILEEKSIPIKRDAVAELKVLKGGLGK